MGTRETIKAKNQKAGQSTSSINAGDSGIKRGVNQTPNANGSGIRDGSGNRDGATFRDRSGYDDGDSEKRIEQILGQSESTRKTGAGIPKAETGKPERKTTRPKPKQTARKSAVEKDEGELSPFEFAGGVLTALETTASALVGENVPMDAVPRTFMQASLGNMLSRMDASQMEQFSRIADPLVLVVCAGVYVAKIMTVINQKKEEDNETSATDDKPENGRSTHESSFGGKETGDRIPLAEYGVSNP